MRYHHLRHHRDSGMPSDPYFKAGVDENPALYALNVARGLLLVPFWTVRPWFGLLAWLVPGLRQAYARVFLQDRSGTFVGDHPEVLACARAELGQVVFQLGLFGLAVWFPLPFVLGYLLPATLAGVLAAWRVLLEHRYVPVTDRRLSTIFAITWDHHLHPAVRWLFAPRNIGYHVVHHVHPFVGLRHLPALREWYRSNHPSYPEPR
jgi:fatty acid desaturase